ncbi:hypothetical protein DPMN_162844 [Dreissena polymorpha]|uniref:Uncharacterized protein n=1 Tax=Dreissena polymorpha TaxID=45954 RepID=A0A9D4IUP5_DREPO|nr:hypothetical protein DPMN_162844 [Dreissena polymorpha]
MYTPSTCMVQLGVRNDCRAVVIVGDEHSAELISTDMPRQTLIVKAYQRVINANQTIEQ